MNFSPQQIDLLSAALFPFSEELHKIDLAG